MEHASGVEGAELPSGQNEDDDVAFDSSRFARELASVLGMEAQQHAEDDSEEGSSFYSQGSSESGASSAPEPGAACALQLKSWSPAGATTSCLSSQVATASAKAAAVA